MTRIPLAYPKIPGSAAAPLANCFAFEKYDGTNIHWAWNRELGWHAFGTRRNRYDLDSAGVADFHQNHEGLEGISELFQSNLGPRLEAIFHDNPRYGDDDIVVFTEFLGDQSFAGMHRHDDPKSLVLLDVQTASGIVLPADFVRDFEGLAIARLIYRGKLTAKFAEEVRQGKYDVTEGVVCKGGSSVNDLWMVKIKTNAYMERLKQAFAGDWESYWE